MSLKIPPRRPRPCASSLGYPAPLCPLTPGTCPQTVLTFPEGDLMNRRDFLARAGAAAGAAISLDRFPHHLFASPAPKNATDRVQLGPMKIELSRLAQGTGTNGVGGSSNQTRQLGLGGLADLFHAAYDNGVTFWDSADQYGTHPHVKEALKSV